MCGTQYFWCDGDGGWPDTWTAQITQVGQWCDSDRRGRDRWTLHLFPKLSARCDGDGGGQTDTLYINAHDG